MYVIDKNDRYLNIIIGALIFALIASLVKTRLYLVALWETGLQEFLATPPNFLERLLAFLSAPGFCVLYVFFIWFFLWGFKHKLIAFWSLIIFFSGEIIFILIRLITYRPLPTGHPKNLSISSFPNHHLFSLGIIFYIVYIAVIPLIRSIWQKYLLIFCMLAIAAILLVAEIKLKIAYPLDLFASVSLVYLWMQIAQLIYTKWFGNLWDIQIFKNSDYN